jgi:hypothetical protein
MGEEEEGFGGAERSEEVKEEKGDIEEGWGREGKREEEKEEEERWGGKAKLEGGRGNPSTGMADERDDDVSAEDEGIKKEEEVDEDEEERATDRGAEVVDGLASLEATACMW